ncbi:hypothetical protein [Brevundimonas sp.]|uniref:hypothetical protein n=1 Tax=Brevundimonas sp. TaxID=1871086 RepID=UPI00289E3B3B|nr:hypothetical protein [Brevundimonas sp.]
MTVYFLISLLIPKVGWMNFLMFLLAGIAAFFAGLTWLQGREAKETQQYKDRQARQLGYELINEAVKQINVAKNDFIELHRLKRTSLDYAKTARARLKLISATTARLNLLDIEEEDRKSVQTVLHELQIFETELHQLMESDGLPHDYVDRARYRCILINKKWPNTNNHAATPTANASSDDDDSRAS